MLEFMDYFEQFGLDVGTVFGRFELCSFDCLGSSKMDSWIA